MGWWLWSGSSFYSILQALRFSNRYSKLASEKKKFVSGALYISLTFDRSMVTPVREDTWLDFFVETGLHAVHVL